MMKIKNGQIMLWMNIMALCLVVSVITMRFTIVDEMKHLRAEPVHKCREFILWKGDTVEVIYTVHEYQHIRKHTVKPLPNN